MIFTIDVRIILFPKICNNNVTSNIDVEFESNFRCVSGDPMSWEPNTSIVDANSLLGRSWEAKQNGAKMYSRVVLGKVLEGLGEVLGVSWKGLPIQQIHYLCMDLVQDRPKTAPSP